MRKLLDSLSGLMKRETNPLLDLRAAAQWTRDIRQGDVNQQLAAVKELVAGISTLEPIGLPTLRCLMIIDEQSQTAFETLCRQYIQNPRMGKQIEEKLWMDIMAHARAMLAAYHRFVRMEEHKPTEESGFQQLSALMLARSLRYIGLQVKWHFFRFEMPPVNLWAGANQLYRLAEVSAQDVSPIKLYPEHEGPPSSCADEFLRIQMLATLNNGNFSLRQYDWADRWLAMWSGQIQIERKYRDNIHQFCVNLAEPSGPTKIHDVVEGDMLRFWGVVDLLTEMNRIMRELDSGISPSRAGLGDDARMPACLDFMRQLEILWSRERSNNQARSERTKVNKLIDVAHGLSNIFNAVRSDDERVMARASSRRAPDADEVMDMKLYGYVTERTKQKVASQELRNHAYVSKVKAVERDSWIVENQSEGGFGAILPLEGHDWVRLGVLLAVRNDENSAWLIAVVRRLNRLNNEQLYAGVQILTSTAVSLSMHVVGGENRSMEMSVEGLNTIGLKVPSSGLYIPYQTKDRKANSVLVHSVDYQLDHLYEVKARDKEFSVRFSDTLEKGPDWIWAVVEVVR